MTTASTPATPPAAAWREALETAIATDPRGRAGVAERLDVSRAYVSRVASGHMPAPPKFAQRVAATYLRVECPHLKASISPQECQAYAARSYAQCSQFEVDHWRACKACPHKAPQPVAAPEPKAPAPVRPRQRRSHAGPHDQR